MATATRHHSIMNPARRKNRRKRNLSAKQIKAGFGGKRRQQNLKHRRRNAGGKIITGYGSTVMNRAKRKKRNAPHGAGGRVIAGYGSTTMNRGKRRKNKSSGQHSKHVVIVNRKKNRRKAAHRTPRRSNPGEILSLTLGNPAKRRSMAARKKANRRTNARHHHRKHHRRNPSRRVNVRHHRVRHHRRNAGAMNVTNLFTEGLSALVGMAGSRLLTQAVLGASNIGAYGYAGNAAATAVLAGLAHMFFKGKPAVRDGIIIGGAAGILARAMTDYTPFGGYLTQAGFAGMPAGDYSAGGSAGLGLYLPTNAVTPARYIGSSAMTEIPDGWGAPVMAPAGVGTYGRGRAGRY